MNNPTVKLYLDSIIKCCLLCLIVFASLSCRLRLRFSLPLIKITARIDRPQTQRNWQRSRIEIHQSPHKHWPQFDPSLTVVFSKRSGLGMLHWLLAANWRTCNSLFGFELQNSPALDSQKKSGKNKILRSTCGKCNFSKNSNRINIRLWNRG